MVWAAPVLQSSPSSDRGLDVTEQDQTILALLGEIIALEVEQAPLHYRHQPDTGLPCNRRNAR
jgi:hypothetical protein